MVTPDKFWTLVIEKPTLTPSRQRKIDDLEHYLKEKWEFTNNPIEYINIHYNWDSNLWIEPKSLEDLWIFLKDKWISYATPDGLHKFLKATWFIFRPNTEQTEKWKTSLRLWESNAWRLEGSLHKFHKALTTVISWDNKEKISFDFNYYKEIKKPIDKVLYLLWIDKEALWKIKKITSLWSQAIMTAVNITLVDIIHKLRNDWFEIKDIKISKWSINNLLSKLNL